jgi:hypothetical protein
MLFKNGCSSEQADMSGAATCSRSRRFLSLYISLAVKSHKIINMKKSAILFASNKKI